MHMPTPITHLCFALFFALVNLCIAFNEMLSVLVLALEVMNEEAKPLGLTINCAKTKIQTTDTTVSPGTLVQVGGSSVEIVDTFTCLGSQLHSSYAPPIRPRLMALYKCALID